MTEQTAAPAREIKVGEPKDPSQCYPKNGIHTWNAFAGLAVEMGGYRDLYAIDPYTGRRLWMSDAFDQIPADSDQPETSVYDALRRLVDAMEAERFLDRPDGNVQF